MDSLTKGCSEASASCHSAWSELLCKQAAKVSGRYLLWACQMLWPQILHDFERAMYNKTVTAIIALTSLSLAFLAFQQNKVKLTRRSSRSTLLHGESQVRSMTPALGLAAAVCKVRLS